MLIWIMGPNWNSFAHFIAAWRNIGHTIEDYVHHCYSIELLTQTYGSCVYPINGPKLWPQSYRETILAPKKIRKGGRPKKKRKKELGELNNPYKMKRIGHIKCNQCEIVGHNKKRCNPATQASKQQRVRLVIVIFSFSFFFPLLIMHY